MLNDRLSHGLSDIDTAMVVDSLKVLDPKRPIREADIFRVRRYVSKVPISDSSSPLAYCPASTYAALGQTRPGPYRIILGARLTWRSPMPGRKGRSLRSLCLEGDRNCRVIQKQAHASDAAHVYLPDI